MAARLVLLLGLLCAGGALAAGPTNGTAAAVNGTAGPADGTAGPKNGPVAAVNGTAGPANTTASAGGWKKAKERDAKLDKQLQKFQDMQKGKNDTSKEVVTSDLVEEAAPAQLWNADADVSTVGACEADIEHFCFKEDPGLGRLAMCLSQQLAKEAKGNARAGGKVSKGCREELEAFKRDRATNVNKDVPLARACREDVSRYCKGQPDVLDCLRDVKKKKLTPHCAEAVYEEQEEEAKDWAVDPVLHKACSADVDSFCSDSDDDEEGAVTKCLIEHIGQLSIFCSDALHHAEEQRSGDVRLDRALYQGCSSEMNLFCEGVGYDDGQMEACLEEHIDGEGFSERCREELEMWVQRHSVDYELNYGLREYCAEDIDELCHDDREKIDFAEGYGADAQVLQCLETKRAHVREPRCAQEVHKQLGREANDIRLDHQLAAACAADVKEHCGVKPGSARVIHCLQDARAKLRADCSTKLFLHEQRLAEDIDFKYPLKRACVVELALFCTDVPHGHARVVRCLQDKFDDEQMSDECRDEVKRDEIQSSQDYRLNFRLLHACDTEVKRMCKAEAEKCELKGQAGELCGGLVINCLRDALDEIRGEECRNEVFHLIKKQVLDHRNDPELTEACKTDISTHCRAAKPGWGRVHACLRDHWSQLSAECRAQELRLSILQGRDIRLRPSLQAICAQEAAVFCRGVEPGKACVFRCLAAHMGEPGFSADCQRNMASQIAAAQKDYRLDYGIGATCQADVERECKGELEHLADGGGAELRCLVRSFKRLAGGCQDELARGVRQALWAYRAGAPLTRMCDADVKAQCPSLQVAAGTPKVGAVGRCLSQKVAEGAERPVSSGNDTDTSALSAGCRQLVLVAAPRDARAVFDSSMSLEQVTAKVAQIAHNAGLSATFVNPNKPGLGAVTVTGWVAVLCVGALVAVVLGMLGFALWRATLGSQQHRYTQLVREGGPLKEGDV